MNMEVMKVYSIIVLLFHLVLLLIGILTDKENRNALIIWFIIMLPIVFYIMIK